MANFVKLASEQTGKLKEVAINARGGDGRITMDKITKNQVYVYARESVTIAYVVNRLASGYVDFSKNHLMGPVAKLPSLMTLDKESDRHQIREQKAAIMKGCNDAQNALEQMVVSEKKEFDRALEARLAYIKQEIGAVTSNLSNADVQEIREVVEGGIEESKSVLDETDY